MTRRKSEARIRRILERLERLEYRILRTLCPPHIHHFHIAQENPMNALIPGATATFTATPQPAGVELNPNLPVPVWTGTGVDVTADATGLVATVTIPATAAVDSTFILTVSYTNADGSKAEGSFNGTVVAPPPPPFTGPNVQSFNIAQTA